ncbi:hypothetical protein ACTI_42430 [Actinoplanes sp. OR16]|nr:hypothetical protein ACTI_42430 [Actinoplanes sp. OR16]
MACEKPPAEVKYPLFLVQSVQLGKPINTRLPRSPLTAGDPDKRLPTTSDVKAPLPAGRSQLSQNP